MPKIFFAYDKTGSMSDTSDSDTEMVTPPSSFYSPCSSPITSDDSQMFDKPDMLADHLDNARFRFPPNSVGLKFSEISAFKQIERKEKHGSGSSINNGAQFGAFHHQGGIRRAYMESTSLQNGTKVANSVNNGLICHNGFSFPVSTVPYSVSSNFLPSDIGSVHLSASGTCSPPQENNPDIFLHADPRIPFSNYFNNLVKLLQNAAAKGELGKVKLSNSRGECINLFNFDWNKDSVEENDCNGNIGQEESDNVATRRIPDPCNRLSIVQNSPKDNSFAFAGNRKMSFSSCPHRTTSPSSTRTSLMNVYSSPSGTIEPYFNYPNMAVAPIGTSFPMTHKETFNMTSPLMGPHPPHVQISSACYRGDHADKPAPPKKYKCDVCCKAFSRSNTLVTHKRIHTGAKPFKCELCGRAFRQPGNLTRHRLTHTTMKPYVCPQCNKAFNRASNLHTHMRTHANFKPFVCRYCGQGFNQKTELKVHSYSHTAKERRYTFAGPSDGH